MSGGLGISVEIRGLASEKEFLKQTPRETSRAMRIALRKGAQQVARFWKLRLSGPATRRQLGVQTGALRRSISVGRMQPFSIAIGTDKRYAAPHEFGFRGLVNVRPHLRLGRPVRGHQRQANMPKRPHRAPAVRDSRPVVERLFAGEVDKALERARTTANRIKFQQRAQLGDLRRAGLTGRR